MLDEDGLLKKIEREAEKLSAEERLKLIEVLVHQLAERDIREPLDMRELYGAGKGLWEEDAQRYVNRLREDRV